MNICIDNLDIRNIFALLEKNKKPRCSCGENKNLTYQNQENEDEKFLCNSCGKTFIFKA